MKWVIRSRADRAVGVENYHYRKASPPMEAAGSLGEVERERQGAGVSFEGHRSLETEKWPTEERRCRRTVLRSSITAGVFHPQIWCQAAARRRSPSPDKMAVETVGVR
uniref:Uncharacterized protein n=1 Tax=Cucumis sativus TaxID=3659 RepID=A0A0A0KBX0_CUCSA